MMCNCRYNCENGGPAPEKLTNQIYQNTTKIAQYYIADDSLKVDLDRLGATHFLVQHKDSVKFGQFTVEVCRCTDITHTSGHHQ
jgi:phosphoglucomutase